MKNRLFLLAVLPLAVSLLTVKASATDFEDKIPKSQNTLTFDKLKAISPDRLTEAQKVCMEVVSKIDVPTIDYNPPAPPEFWKLGLLTQAGFSQVSLTNWAGGGSGTIAMNALLDANAFYEKGKTIWENRLQVSYGFTQNFDKDTKYQFRKSDDKFLLDSKWGYSVYDRLYLSASLNFRTQLTDGYSYSSTDRTLLSRFLAPGYLALGVGIDYKPFRILSINVSPLTGNFVIVTEETLRKKYGNNEDQSVRAQLGAQIKVDLKYSYKTFNLGSYLTLFSDYLNNPQNVQVYWNFESSWAIRRFLTLGLRTNLIYDDNIKIADDDGHESPRVQFKEIFSLNFTYTIGQYRKAR